jgi:hypothetical protein
VADLNATKEYTAVNYHEIHQALKDIGLTWASAAEAIGCAPSNLMMVAKSPVQRSRNVARRLAVLLDRDVAEIFPNIPAYAEADPMEQRRAQVDAARQRLCEAGIPPLDLKSA